MTPRNPQVVVPIPISMALYLKYVVDLNTKMRIQLFPEANLHLHMDVNIQVSRNSQDICSSDQDLPTDKVPRIV